MFESEYSRAAFETNSRYVFEWLSEQGRKHNFTPVLELDALNKYVYEEETLSTLLEEYSNIMLCLDTARLYVQDRLDPNFDATSVIKHYAKYAELVHLSNIRLAADNRIITSRHPVLPRLQPDEGWAPIDDYFKILRRENGHFKVMFEHQSSLIGDDELLTCYSWVAGLLDASCLPVWPS